MPIALSPVPLRVGLVGTGYAAKLRAESLLADPRAQLVAIAGHAPAKTQAFSQTYRATGVTDWQRLLDQFDLDLIVIAGVNRDHGAIAHAALTAGKHVVVEYPLCLDVLEADALLALAQSQNRLLHVEHIELLGGVHQALKTSLDKVGTVFHARYATIKADHPAPVKWTYHPDLFGFPLMGALSRLHRLVDLFGPVTHVSCQTQFHEPVDSAYYQACLCTAQLRFDRGVMAEVVYGKGDRFWRSHRHFEVQGDQGGLLFDGDQGTLVQADGSYPLPVNGRRGLFSKDTAMVLDHLTTGAPLYVRPEVSVYTLKVADAARRSALAGKRVEVPSPTFPWATTAIL
jgi:biliverdin reductase